MLLGFFFFVQIEMEDTRVYNIGHHIGNWSAIDSCIKCLIKRGCPIHYWPFKINN